MGFNQIIQNIFSSDVTSGRITVNGEDVTSSFKDTSPRVKKDYSEILTDEVKSLRVNGSLSVLLAVDSAVIPYVKLHCSEKVLKNIKIHVVNHELLIETVGSFSTNQPIEVNVGLNFLSVMELQGSGDIEGSYTGEKLDILLTGSGNIELEGEVETLNLSLQGSGDIVVKELEAQKVTASLFGSGDIKTLARESFKGQLKGSGDIKVFGNSSQWDANVEGSGDIKRK